MADGKARLSLIATRHIHVAVLLLVAFALAEQAAAQLFERAVVIEHARIVQGATRVIEDGSIVIKGGRIQSLGATVDAPMFSKKFDASGKTVTAGFIDAWSSLGHTGGSEEADATATAWDAYDTHAADEQCNARRWILQFFERVPLANRIIPRVRYVQSLCGSGDWASTWAR